VIFLIPLHLPHSPEGRQALIKHTQPQTACEWLRPWETALEYSAPGSPGEVKFYCCTRRCSPSGAAGVRFIRQSFCWTTSSYCSVTLTSQCARVLGRRAYPDFPEVPFASRSRCSRSFLGVRGAHPCGCEPIIHEKPFKWRIRAGCHLK